MADVTIPAPPSHARQIVFPAIRQAAWERVPLPPADRLGPTELLMRAACTLVSAGTEIAVYSGTHIGYTLPGQRYPQLPFRPGYAFAGTVVAAGVAVKDFKAGDRVGGTMPHADWTVVDTAGAGQLARLPDGVSFEQGCLARLASIAMQGVRLARVRLGERIAVFGQGLIGQLALQLAALDGAAVTVAVDVLDSRLEVARAHGATHVVNPARDALAAAIAAATGGEGVDVAIEATGQPAVINDALRAAARMGRVILLGSPRGRVEIDPYSDIHRKGVSLIGAHEGTTARAPNAYHRWTRPAHYRVALELMRQSRLRTDGLITHRAPADDALAVFDALTDRPREHLGVVIDWT